MKNQAFYFFLFKAGTQKNNPIPKVNRTKLTTILLSLSSGLLRSNNPQKNVRLMGKIMYILSVS